MFLGGGGDWRKLRNALLRDLYSSPDRMVSRTCGTHGKEETVVVRKAEAHRFEVVDAKTILKWKLQKKI